MDQLFAYFSSDLLLGEQLLRRNNAALRAIRFDMAVDFEELIKSRFWNIRANLGNPCLWDYYDDEVSHAEQKDQAWLITEKLERLLTETLQKMHVFVLQIVKPSAVGSQELKQAVTDLIGLAIYQEDNRKMWNLGLMQRRELNGLFKELLAVLVKKKTNGWFEVDRNLESFTMNQQFTNITKKGFYRNALATYAANNKL
ncbi:unnamed protein product [Orchesella dallaii]|uniref:Uncharacterized protein n=1 Tax=Orchesella dallaii TaxID=48710 RepID=A0ABP1PS98_9HEXA